MFEVPIEAQAIMRQAPSTIAEYFGPVVRMLDDHFGAGYAAKHPALIGELVAACAVDFQTMIWAKAFGEGLRDVVETLDRFVEE